jgi:hypothetical protein
MSNETNSLNLVKKYFNQFILCANCQKEDIEDRNKELELSNSQLNSNSENIISNTFDISDSADSSNSSNSLAKNNENKHNELNSSLNSSSNNSINPDENICINLNENPNYFAKEKIVYKKEENITEISKLDDDNFELV